MLLDIPLADVLYLDGKVTGGYGLGNCIYFVQSFQSPAVEEYMQTRKFQECTKWDRILHQVANRRYVVAVPSFYFHGICYLLSDLAILAIIFYKIDVAWT